VSKKSQKGKSKAQTSSDSCTSRTHETTVLEASKSTKGAMESQESERKRASRKQSNKMSAKRNQNRKRHQINHTREAGAHTIQGIDPGDGKSDGIAYKHKESREKSKEQEKRVNQKRMSSDTSRKARRQSNLLRHQATSRVWQGNQRKTRYVTKPLENMKREEEKIRVSNERSSKESETKKQAKSKPRSNQVHHSGA
jgi:hypothetical protein